MFLSIVIPAYNEEECITSTLSYIDEFLASKDYEAEIIVVDDGSDDNTVKTVIESELRSKGKIRVLKNGINRGKGFSVKSGILDSKGEYVLLSDADMSTPIEEVEKLFNSINSGFDIAIGSRSIKNSDVRIKQAWYREMMGKTFNLLVKLLTIRDFNDTQCGFKIFKGDMIRELANLMMINGFCFDVEMLYLAHTKGYKIDEVGVIWNNSSQSKVKVLDSSLHMFLDLLRIKKLHK